MNGERCETIRDLLPERTRGSLSATEEGRVEAHLSSCPDCRREADIVARLFQVRPDPPAELAARIQSRLREGGAAVEEGGARGFEMPAVPVSVGEERGSPRGSGETLDGKKGVLPFWLRSWALPAAAVVILALGTGILMDERTPEVTGDPIQVAVQESAPEEWLWDDGMVAGAPVFEDLTEEELTALLEEFEG